MDGHKPKQSLQLSRRGLFQTVLAGSVAGTALRPVAAQYSPQFTGIARCVTPQVQTEYGAFAAANLALNLSDLTFSGGMANNTDRRWSWATFLVKMHDDHGQSIGHDDHFDGYFYLKGISRGETQPVASVDGKSPTLLLQPSRRPASFEIKFIPERSYFDSGYAFKLVHPAAGDALAYQDDALKIDFTVTQSELQFRLANRQSEAATIDWEKAAYMWDPLESTCRHASLSIL